MCLSAVMRAPRGRKGIGAVELASMVDLDPEQRDVLLWILGEGSGEVVVAPVGTAEEVDLVIPRGPRRRVAEPDVARLIDLLLLQHVQRKLYRVTELGREAVRPPT